MAGSGEKLPGALCVGPGVPLVDCIVDCCSSFSGAFSSLLNAPVLLVLLSCFVMDHPSFTEWPGFGWGFFHILLTRISIKEAHQLCIGIC